MLYYTAPCSALYSSLYFALYTALYSALFSAVLYYCYPAAEERESNASRRVSWAVDCTAHNCSAVHFTALPFAELHCTLLH